jgi:hypothetical protein
MCDEENAASGPRSRCKTQPVVHKEEGKCGLRHVRKVRPFGRQESSAAVGTRGRRCVRRHAREKGGRRRARKKVACGARERARPLAREDRWWPAAYWKRTRPLARENLCGRRHERSRTAFRTRRKSAAIGTRETDAVIDTRGQVRPPAREEKVRPSAREKLTRSSTREDRYGHRHARTGAACGTRGLVRPAARKDWCGRRHARRLACGTRREVRSFGMHRERMRPEARENE